MSVAKGMSYFVELGQIEKFCVVAEKNIYFLTVQLRVLSASSYMQLLARLRKKIKNSTSNCCKFFKALHQNVA
jgi:hypothetical protein